MGASARKVEIADLVVAIVHPEECGLGQHGFEAEGRAHMGVEVLLKPLRRQNVIGDNMLAQVGEIVFLQIFVDPLFILWSFDGPIDRSLAQVRHGREHVPAVMPLRRHARIRRRRTVEVEREIVRQVRASEDLRDQLLVPRAKANRVVANILILSVGREIGNEERHGEPLLLKALADLPASRGLAKQLLIRVDNVRVRSDGVEVLFETAFGAHSFEFAAHLGNFFHRVANDGLAAQILEQLAEPAHERSRAAARKPDTPLALQRMDEGIDRACLVRITAHQKRVEAEGLAQLRVLDEVTNPSGNGALSLQGGQGRRLLDHRPEIEERHVAELQITLFEQSF